LDSNLRKAQRKCQRNAEAGVKVKAIAKDSAKPQAEIDKVVCHCRDENMSNDIQELQLYLGLGQHPCVACGKFDGKLWLLVRRQLAVV